MAPQPMISRYLSYNRATYSANGVNAGINNIPGDKELKALQLLGEHIYDRICDEFGLVFASSVFRNLAVNKLAGGSKTSGHVKGECIDVDGDAPNAYFVKVDNNKLFKWIKDNLKYDQLIAEYELNGSPKWIHIGFRAVGNRQQTLIATKNSANKTVYMLYSDKLYQRIYRNSRDINFYELVNEFIMPATDFQTFVDENVEDTMLQLEFTGNRAVDLEHLIEETPAEPVEPVEPVEPETLIEAVGPGIGIEVNTPEVKSESQTIHIGKTKITITVETDL